LSLPHEAAPGFEEIGLLAFTTTREAGSFNLGGPETAGTVFARWEELARQLRPRAPRLASAHQVHGTDILEHGPGWTGWLRAPAGDGHVSLVPGTAMAVSLADCVPVFIGHPSGAAAVLHAGWRGTSAGIVGRGIARMRALGLAPAELTVHLGPGVCGRCYEVGPDVYGQLTGASSSVAAKVDLRALLAADAKRAGVTRVTASDSCTRCRNDRYFSHRAGDVGRQLGVVVTAPVFLDHPGGHL
jgi:YfiH family protein